MTGTDLLGYTAGLLTTLAFVPQMLRTIRTRSARDLSWGMLIIFVLGVVFWLAYGVALGSMPIILCNAVTLVLNVAILAVKARPQARAATEVVR